MKMKSRVTWLITMPVQKYMKPGAISGYIIATRPTECSIVILVREIDGDFSFVNYWLSHFVLYSKLFSPQKSLSFVLSIFLRHFF